MIVPFGSFGAELAAALFRILGFAAVAGLAALAPLLAPGANATMLAVIVLALVVGLSIDLSGDRAEPATTSRPSLPRWLVGALLIGIVWLGATLRLHGLDFGQPARYHPDEVAKVNAVMRMVQHGDLNPRYFLHPSLLLYATYLMNTALRHLCAGASSMPFDESAFIAGRLVSALAGSLSIVVLFYIARRLMRVEAALVAAAILAFAPLHVTSSRYLKEDALLTFWILLTLLFIIKAVADDRRWWLVPAGIAAGLSAGSKYSGALSAAFVLAAPWVAAAHFRGRLSLAAERRFLLPAFVGLLAVGGAFLASTPYSMLDSAKFLKDLGYEQRHMSKGHTSGVDGWSQLWMYHLSRSLNAGLTQPVLLAALVGCGVMLRRFQALTWFMIAALLAFYLPAEWVKAKPAPQPERYVLPCVPLLAISTGMLVDRMRISERALHSALWWCLASVLILTPLVRSLQLASELSPETRDRMAQWITMNLPPGTRVVLDWNSYSPPIEGRGLNVTYIARNKPLQELNVDRLRRSGAEYVVVSSLFYQRFLSEPNFTPAHRQPFRELARRLTLVHEEAPRYGTYGFHNPTLRLYRIH